MTPDQATHALRGARTVPVLHASISAVKELHAACLEHGVAAAMVRPPAKGGG